MKLTLAIRTRGRADNQLSLKKFYLEEVCKALPWVRFRIIMPSSEKQAYVKYQPWTREFIRVTPDDYRSGDVFQFLTENFGRYILAIDDDLQLDHRRDPASPSQRGASGRPTDVIQMLKRVRSWFEKGYVHGGLSLRANNHYCIGETFKTNTRVCGADFWDAEILNSEGILFNQDGLQVRSDFHAWVSLLELGYPNVCDYEFMVGQNGAGKGKEAGSNAPGGCSTYRTPEYMEQQTILLQELHPESVSIRFKKRVTASALKLATDQGVPDVRIGWQKCLGIKANLRKADTTGKLLAGD